MSAITRLRVMLGIGATSAALLGISNLPVTRDFLSKYLGSHTTKYAWRILFIFLAFLNLKNLPLFWHIRVFRGIFYQLYLQPNPQKPKHLFAPMITSSYNTLYDTDYNFHKSNSTYFQDLDVARAHYMGCIIRTGLVRLNKGDEKGLPKDVITKSSDRYMVALGGVSCFFRKQIAPLQGFEIYTRLLSWDRKWLYVVSHIVQKGVIKPKSYALQPWRKSKRRSQDGGKKHDEEEDLTKYIFATSVARYVFKKGRLTINPEIVLERSRLLPPRPEGSGLPPRTEASTSSNATPAPAETPATPAMNGEHGNAEAVVTAASQRLDKVASHGGNNEEDEDWTWEDMERERLRGLQIASHFDALGAVQNDLKADEALGQFGDYW